MRILKLIRLKITVKLTNSDYKTLIRIISFRDEADDDTVEDEASPNEDDVQEEKW